MKTNALTKTAILAALICICAPLSVSLGPIPLSLATFAVYVAAAVLGAKRGALAVLIYILIGAIGFPVFSGFAGGLQRLTGVTGGYIAGYIPCALIAGLFSEHSSGTKLRLFGMALGTVACYAMGTAWFVYTTGTGVLAALSVCVLPFLIGDGVKMIAAAAIAAALQKTPGLLAHC